MTALRSQFERHGNLSAIEGKPLFGYDTAIVPPSEFDDADTLCRQCDALPGRQLSANQYWTAGCTANKGPCDGMDHRQADDRPQSAMSAAFHRELAVEAVEIDPKEILNIKNPISVRLEAAGPPGARCSAIL